LGLTPADLSAVVAAVLGLPVNTVKNYDRRLMEAGLRTKKGHGRGSAIMGPEEAALLIAAVAASDDASQAPECVRKLYSLPFPGVTPETSFLGEIIGAEEKALNTFGKALVAIMKYLVARPDYTHEFGFEVSIHGGVPYAVDLQIYERTPTRFPADFDINAFDINAVKNPRTIEFFRSNQLLFTPGLVVKKYVFHVLVTGLADVLAERLGTDGQAEGDAPVGTNKAKAKSKKRVAWSKKRVA
jgi:hypothetical protein